MHSRSLREVRGSEGGARGFRSVGEVIGGDGGIATPPGSMGVGSGDRRSFDRRLRSGTPPASGHRTGVLQRPAWSDLRFSAPPRLFPTHAAAGFHPRDAETQRSSPRSTGTQEGGFKTTAQRTRREDMNRSGRCGRCVVVVQTALPSIHSLSLQASTGGPPVPPLATGDWQLRPYFASPRSLARAKATRCRSSGESPRSASIRARALAVVRPERKRTL